jgi:hypothetical protein
MWGEGAGACLESASRKAAVQKRRTSSDDIYRNFMANPSPTALIIARFMARQNGVFSAERKGKAHTKWAFGKGYSQPFIDR